MQVKPIPAFQAITKCIDHCSISSVQTPNSVQTSDYGFYNDSSFIWTENAWWIDVSIDIWLDFGDGGVVAKI